MTTSTATPAEEPGEKLFLSIPEGCILHLTKVDALRFYALPKGSARASIVVQDVVTKMYWKVRRWKCGLTCFCAAKGEPVWHLNEGMFQGEEAKPCRVCNASTSEGGVFFAGRLLCRVCYART